MKRARLSPGFRQWWEATSDDLTKQPWTKGLCSRPITTSGAAGTMGGHQELHRGGMESPDKASMWKGAEEKYPALFPPTVVPVGWTHLHGRPARERGCGQCSRSVPGAQSRAEEGRGPRGGQGRRTSTVLPQHRAGPAVGSFCSSLFWLLSKIP